MLHFYNFITCAMHLEEVSSFSTNDYLLSLKRFISRRGKPTEIFRNNGMVFGGAARELQNRQNGTERNTIQSSADCTEQHSTIGQNKAGQSRAEQIRAEQSIVAHSRTEKSRAVQSRTERNRTEQYRTMQNRIEQNRAEQNRTDQIRSGHIRSDQIRSDLIRTDQIRFDQNRTVQIVQN